MRDFLLEYFNMYSILLNKQDTEEGIDNVMDRVSFAAKNNPQSLTREEFEELKDMAEAKKGQLSNNSSKIISLKEKAKNGKRPK